MKAQVEDGLTAAASGVRHRRTLPKIGCVGAMALLLAGSCYNGSLFHPAYSLLMTGIEEGNPDKVELALKLGSGTSPPDDFWINWNEAWFSPLNVAAVRRDFSAMKILLEHGADPNEGDGWDGSPLCSAALNSDIAVMRFLISNGAKVNEQSGYSYCLRDAAESDKVESVKFLLAQGADPNCVVEDSHGRPVRLIDRLKEDGGHRKVVALLVKAGAKSRARE